MITQISFPSPADLLAFISGKNQDEVVDLNSISNCLLSQYFKQKYLGFDYNIWTDWSEVGIGSERLLIPTWFRDYQEYFLNKDEIRKLGLHGPLWVSFRDLAAKLEEIKD